MDDWEKRAKINEFMEIAPHLNAELQQRQVAAFQQEAFQAALKEHGVSPEEVQKLFAEQAEDLQQDWRELYERGAQEIVKRVKARRDGHLPRRGQPVPRVISHPSSPEQKVRLDKIVDERRTGKINTESAMEKAVDEALKGMF